MSVHPEEFPQKIHNLVRLAELSELGASEDVMDFLNRINDFNIEARYPDYKFSFYTTCTSEFTEDHFTRIKELIVWIKSRIR